VNDYAGLLSAADRGRLENLLTEREGATGAQMVIAVFRSLEGESLEDFSIRLAERWRVGQRGLDNGVILVVFLAERRVRLEIGYGLEPVLPDAVASTIISEVIAPRFREGRYASGLESAVNAVFARIENRNAPPAARGGTPPEAWLPFVAFGVVTLVLIVMIASALFGNRHVRRLGPGRRGYTGGPRGWYVPPISPGWRGGGGWGGFSGGGGGGFSGGGGSFGGGGASGQW
jgi:uncharacterized protein